MKITKKKESIKKESIKKESIKKESIKKESIKKESIKKESITKESIKKESIKMYTEEDAIYDLLLFSNEEDITIQSIHIPYQLHEECKLGKELRTYFERNRMLVFVDSVLSDIEKDLIDKKSSSSSSSSSLYKHDSFSLLLKQLPILVDLKLYENLNMKMTTADSSIKQLIKDISRDKIIINGFHVNGSEYGLDGCIRKISYCIDVLTNEMNMEILNDSIKEEIAVTVLKLASRTSSGGLSYQTLLNNIDTDKNVIVPISSLALPLIIKLSMGSFRDENNNTRIGLNCELTTSYYFSIRSLESENDEGKVKVTFVNCINNHIGFHENMNNYNNKIQINSGFVKIENYT
jgi:hypothetical protein